jgi:hypothetical protein
MARSATARAGRPGVSLTGSSHSAVSGCTAAICSARSAFFSRRRFTTEQMASTPAPRHKAKQATPVQKKKLTRSCRQPRHGCVAEPRTPYAANARVPTMPKKPATLPPQSITVQGYRRIGMTPARTLRKRFFKVRVTKIHQRSGDGSCTERPQPWATRHLRKRSQFTPHHADTHLACLDHQPYGHSVHGDLRPTHRRWHTMQEPGKAAGSPLSHTHTPWPERTVRELMSFSSAGLG